MTQQKPLHIVHMGDSITEGQYIDPSVRWTSLIARRLATRFGEDRFVSINRGVSGETTRMGLERYPRDVQERAARSPHDPVRPQRLQLLADRPRRPARVRGGVHREPDRDDQPRSRVRRPPRHPGDEPPHAAPERPALGRRVRGAQRPLLRARRARWPPRPGSCCATSGSRSSRSATRSSIGCCCPIPTICTSAPRATRSTPRRSGRTSSGAWRRLRSEARHGGAGVKTATDIHWNERAASVADDIEVNIMDIFQRDLEYDYVGPYLSSDQRILEVGCGNGFSTERFRELVAHVDAMDYAENMIERARERVGERNNRFILDNILEPDAARGPVRRRRLRAGADQPGGLRAAAARTRGDGVAAGARRAADPRGGVRRGLHGAQRAAERARPGIGHAREHQLLLAAVRLHAAHRGASSS